MEDRELLEMAAKACGYIPKDFVVGEGLWLNNSCPDYGHDWWNPLEDDGDALRLAVDLAISLDFTHPAAVVARPTLPVNHNFIVIEIQVNGIDDYSRATRSAILNAAAEIGRNRL